MFSNNWYNSDSLAEGGYSLEIIDPEKKKEVATTSEEEIKKSFEKIKSIEWVWIIGVVIVLILIGVWYKIKKDKK